MPFRSTARKQRRREDRAEDAHAFRFRHKNAKTIQRMGHIFATKSEHNAGNWRVINIVEGSEARDVHTFNVQPRNIVRSDRDNDRAC